MTKTTDHLANAQRLAKILDSQINIFGVRIGLDPIIGLIPGAGDAIALALSLYLLYVADQTGVPAKMQRTMLINLLADFALGLVPVVGDVADVFFRANRKNLEILLSHHQKSGV